jgi:hypothetical protein
MAKAVIETKKVVNIADIFSLFYLKYSLRLKEDSKGP